MFWSTAFGTLCNRAIVLTPCKVSGLTDKLCWCCRGLDVRVKRWDKSAHCAHFRKHPDEYIAEVQAFLTKVSKP